MRNKYVIGITLLLLIAVYPVQAQSAGKKISLSGNVIDQSGKPVVGAHMVVDEILLNNITGPKGQFRIKVLPTSSRIGVSVKSLSAIEQPINGRKGIKIVIADSIHEIITAQVKTKIKADPADIVTSYTNIYEMIQAKLPAVQVNGTSLKVRGGATSFQLDTEPLLIVDGIVVSSFSSISPQEVNTISLLKGPDASIYGSRGANGVILITLKKRKQP